MSVLHLHHLRHPRRIPQPSIALDQRVRAHSSECESFQSTETGHGRVALKRFYTTIDVLFCVACAGFIGVLVWIAVR